MRSQGVGDGGLDGIRVGEADDDASGVCGAQQLECPIRACIPVKLSPLGKRKVDGLC